ncbi:hypothetical protein [Salinicoccus luteus]|uniref:hypothetical protein n=1 Tax=Salinicoccus luteus TaxID=367840 RepID=UPI0004E10FAC|nr:hypothetical protein [Salinicoccus luteus]
MWKIENKKNDEFLLEFEKLVIRPIFKIILDLKRLELESEKPLNINEEQLWKYTNTYKDQSLEVQKLISNLMKKKVSKIVLFDLVAKIVQEEGLLDLLKLYRLYINQNNKVHQKCYSLEIKNIPETFKILFNQFYYTAFFDNVDIWALIGKGEFTRKTFHENFKKENKIMVCPYCDIDTTISISNNSVEHFLPKSKFPFLSMNAMNLIPSCTACNKSYEGKGETTLSPITMPYNEQIGDSIEFKIDYLNGRITLNSDKNINILNYVKLLKLKERYSQLNVYIAVDSKMESLYSTLSQSPQLIGKRMYEYIELQKNSGLTFIVKNNIYEYLRYRKYLNTQKKNYKK